MCGKVGSIPYSNIAVTDFGVAYSEGNKYGTVSFDGKSDSCKKYEYIGSRSNHFFEVVSTIPADMSDAASMNVFGAADAAGNIIIPEEYAAFDYLNERYIQTIKVNGTTDSKDDAILYGTANTFLKGIRCWKATSFTCVLMILNSTSGVQ